MSPAVAKKSGSDRLHNTAYSYNSTEKTHLRNVLHSHNLKFKGLPEAIRTFLNPRFSMNQPNTGLRSTGNFFLKVTDASNFVQQICSQERMGEWFCAASSRLRQASGKFFFYFMYNIWQDTGIRTRVAATANQ